MHQHGYIGRKMRQPPLRDKPAIITAAFGSTARAKSALDAFTSRLASELPDHEHFLAYTSEIIRRKAGLPSLQEILARVEAAGYRKAVVQPLHVFPGTEYQQLAETCNYFPGLRVFLSETLCHRWDFIKECLEVVERDFLPPDQGLNLLALHGTPLAADPVNIVYLGLEKLVSDRYSNVFAASIEGIPDWDGVLARIGRHNLVQRYPRLRIIPLVYFAGLHAEEDLMGEKESWRAALTEMGFAVECSMIRQGDVQRFKGLAYYPEMLSFFMARLQRALTLAHYY